MAAAGPAAATAAAAARRRGASAAVEEAAFISQHYGSHGMMELDTVFNVFYIVMLVSSRKLNPSKLRPIFDTVLATCLAMLGLKVLTRPTYQRYGMPRRAACMHAHAPLLTDA